MLTVPEPIEDPRPYLLDIHVLDSDRLPDTWFEQCMDSIFASAREAPFRTEVHWCDEVVGDEFAARKAAYAQGSAPYVAKVDMDDWIAIDTLPSIADALMSGSNVVITDAIHIFINEGNRRIRGQGGFRAFKRELLDRIDWSNADNACCVDCAMGRIAGKPEQVHSIGLYRRRGYNSLATQQRRAQHAVG